MLRIFVALLLMAGMVLTVPGGLRAQSRWPASFGIGRPATLTEIRALDGSIRPDGRGLPAGTGKSAAGRVVYAQKCAACHGKAGEGGAAAKLVGAMGDTTKAKTIGNYWPYATTLFDYIRRAMPYNAAGSLSNEEVYHLTAYLLAANRVIDSNFVVSSHSLPGIVMPAKKFFIADDRKGGREIR